MGDREFDNWALICHNQRDGRWRDWLSKRLGVFRTPRAFVGKPTADGSVPRRIDPVASLQTEDDSAAPLSEANKSALNRSRYLVVICSPHSAQCGWIDQAVRHFKSLGREHRVIAMIVAGEPYASSRLDPEGEECLPRALKYEVDSEGEITDTPSAPFAADLRPGKDGRHAGLLKMASGMLRVDHGELKQRDHDRGQIQMTGVLAGALLLLFLFCGLTSYAFMRARDAETLAGESRSEAAFARSEGTKRAIDLKSARNISGEFASLIGSQQAGSSIPAQSLPYLAFALRNRASDDKKARAADVETLSNELNRLGHGAPEQAGVDEAGLLACAAEAIAGFHLNREGRPVALNEDTARELRDHAEILMRQSGNDAVNGWVSKILEFKAPSRTAGSD